MIYLSCGGDVVDYKIEYVPVEELTPYAKNAKKHPEEQIKAIE